MSSQPRGKLNRQELGWLLTQEAQGAAERLRKGVQVLMTNPPPPGDEEPGVQDTLDVLDDAMRALSSLHQRPVGARGRRGRIDLAALLWEMAPDARVSIEPGGGTEVFGDESELRRMLHVFIGPGSRAGSAITVRGEGKEVQLLVTLGPDSSVASDTERAWLARMAMRYGGRYELAGGQEMLAFPAEDPAEKEAREKEALRRELDEARRQGAAFARELAALYGHGDELSAPSSFPPAGGPSLERLTTATRLAGGIAAELRRMLAPVGWDLMALRPPTSSVAADERIEAIQRRLVLAQDFIAELSSVGELDATELPMELDVCEAIRSCIRNAEGRATRAGVDVRFVTVPEDPDLRVLTRAPLRGIGALLRLLVSHALSATPRGRAVTLTLDASDTNGQALLRLTIEDGGHSVPAAARRALAALELEPGTYGRPSGLALYFAQTIASWLGASFALEDAPTGGVRVHLSLTRSA